MNASRIIKDRNGRLIPVEYKRPLGKGNGNHETDSPSLSDLIRARGLDGGLVPKTEPDARSNTAG